MLFVDRFLRVRISLITSFLCVISCLHLTGCRWQKPSPYEIATYLKERTVGLALQPKTASSSWTATAFFISGDGLLLTTAHSLEGAETTYVSLSNRPAKLIAKDPTLDLAILKVDGLEKPVPFINVQNFKAGVYGEDVYSMGTPFGEVDSFFTNTVSKPHTFGGDPTEPDASYLQLDRIFFPGFSGAPVINGRFQLIGVARHQVVVTESKHSGLGFAIHSENVYRFVSPYISE